MHFAEKIVFACDDVYLDQVLHYEDIESSVIVGIVEVTNLDKGATSRGGVTLSRAPCIYEHSKD